MKIKKFLPQVFLLVIALILSISYGVKISSSTADNNINTLNNFSQLKFAQISDVHIDTKSRVNSRRLTKDSVNLFKDAIDQINNLNNIDFVVFSGDTVNLPSEKNLLKFLELSNTFKMPWYIAIGNHDIGISGGLTRSQYFSLASKFNKNMSADKSYYSFIPKKRYLVIMLDGVIDSSISAHGFFSEKQLNWLDEQLKNNLDSKVIIVQHFPAVEPFKSSDHNILNCKQYLEILNKHKNVLLVLSGHYHAAKITKAGNIVHVSTPALIEYPNSFRIITIKESPDKITLNFDLKETRLKNLQEKSKKLSRSYKLSYGSEQDRNTTIVIDKNIISSEKQD